MERLHAYVVEVVGRRFPRKGRGDLVKALEGVLEGEGGLRWEDGEMECQLRVGDVVGVPVVTVNRSVAETSTKREEARRYTNDIKLSFRLVGDGALVTFPRGKAREFARLQR